MLGKQPLHLSDEGVPAGAGVEPVGTVAQQAELAADAVEPFLLGHEMFSWGSVLTKGGGSGETRSFAIRAVLPRGTPRVGFDELLCSIWDGQNLAVLPPGSGVDTSGLGGLLRGDVGCLSVICWEKETIDAKRG